jgi:hypothetical protein
MYTLEYLIRIVKELMLARNGFKVSEGGLGSLPIYLNDIAYDLVRDRLLEYRDT